MHKCVRLTWEKRTCADVDDDAEDASMELRACTEPGHYIRRAASFAVDAESGTFGFEVQLLLTEDELKSLKVGNQLCYPNSIIGTRTCATVLGASDI